MNPVYDYVTERIMSLLKIGTIPWLKTWKASEGGPKNLVSLKPYKGINVWLLSCLGYSSPYFLTYKQAVAAGGNVKKGEKGSMVVFWKMLDSKKPGDSKIPLLRYYTVFNSSQCEGLTLPEAPAVNVHNPIEACEAIANGMPQKPIVTFDGSRAYYMPALDVVGMPNASAFVTPEAYYATLFHELSHSTGHTSRLGRKGMEGVASSGKAEYSKEELVAEMSASFLCAEAGIVNAVIENSAAYIQNWLRVLSDDPQMVVNAASQAQKAADFILNRLEDKVVVKEEEE